MPISKYFRPSFYLLVTSYSYIIRKVIYEFIKRNKKYITGKVLDFGCGEKPYKDLFTFSEYVGIDFEQTGHDNKNNHIDCYRDGHTIPYQDAYFDSVMITEVVEHLFDVETVLSECKRVTKEGATILLTCPFIYPEHEQPYDYARYTFFALEHLTKKHGLTIIQFEKGGNAREALFLLLNITLGDLFSSSKNRFFIVLYIPFCFILNVLSIIFSKLPSSNRLYISNLCILKNE